MWCSLVHQKIQQFHMMLFGVLNNTTVSCDALCMVDQKIQQFYEMPFNGHKPCPQFRPSVVLCALSIANSTFTNWSIVNLLTLIYYFVFVFFSHDFNFCINWWFSLLHCGWLHKQFCMTVLYSYSQEVKHFCMTVLYSYSQEVKQFCMTVLYSYSQEVKQFCITVLYSYSQEVKQFCMTVLYSYSQEVKQFCMTVLYSYSQEVRRFIVMPFNRTRIPFSITRNIYILLW